MRIIERYKKELNEIHHHMMKNMIGISNLVNMNFDKDSVFLERGDEGFVHLLGHDRDLKRWFEMTYASLGYSIHKFRLSGISNNQPWLLLQHIEVDESARRSGIGSLLLQDVEAYAKEKESHIAFVVKSGDVRYLHEFYQKNGYQEVGSIGYWKKYRR